MTARIAGIKKRLLGDTVQLVVSSFSEGSGTLFQETPFFFSKGSGTLFQETPFQRKRKLCFRSLSYQAQGNVSSFSNEKELCFRKRLSKGSGTLFQETLFQRKRNFVSGNAFLLSQRKRKF